MAPVEQSTGRYRMTHCTLHTSLIHVWTTTASLETQCSDHTSEAMRLAGKDIELGCQKSIFESPLFSINWGEPGYFVQSDRTYTSYNTSVDWTIWSKFWVWIGDCNTQVSV